MTRKPLPTLLPWERERIEEYRKGLALRIFYNHEQIETLVGIVKRLTGEKA
jgi:hypothetical protein